MPAGPLWVLPGKKQILPQSQELLEEDVEAFLSTAPSPQTSRAQSPFDPRGGVVLRTSRRPSVVAGPPPPTPPVERASELAPPPSTPPVERAPEPAPAQPKLTSPPARRAEVVEVAVLQAGLATPSTAPPALLTSPPTASTVHNHLGSPGLASPRTCSPGLGSPRTCSPGTWPSSTSVSTLNSPQRYSIAPAPASASRFAAVGPVEAAGVAGGLGGLGKAVKGGQAKAGKSSNAALALLAALLVTVIGVVALSSGKAADDGQLGLAGGGWRMEGTSGASWELADSFYGAGGGQQWFRKESARATPGSLLLTAAPTADARVLGHRLGYAGVLGCGRDGSPAAALAGCQSTVVLFFEAGAKCASDPLAARCNATAGKVAPKSKAPPSQLPPATSAMVHSERHRAAGDAIVTHGRLEISLKLPKGDWLRPYVHLLPAPLSAPRAQLSDGLGVRAIRLLDGRGNGCTTFKDGLSASSFASELELGPSELKAKAPGARALFASPDGSPLGDSWVTLVLERSATRLRLTAKRAQDSGAPRRLLLVELEPTATGRQLCTSTTAEGRACVQLGPAPPPGEAEAESAVSGLFDAPLALVAGLAVASGQPGGTAPLDGYWGSELSGGGECGRSWQDGAPDASAKLFAAQAQWLPSWTQPSLEIGKIAFTPAARSALTAASASASANFAAGGEADSAALRDAALRTAKAAKAPKSYAEVDVEDLSPSELAGDMGAVAPLELDSDGSFICAMCISHRCSTNDRTCAVRNGLTQGTKPSAEERWSCLCSCCESQCGLGSSCTHTPAAP
ncbi:hypothetical protein T492DRAFT_1009414 [Pavlovales sp. CCMP2436]|nr:hypothetical protein T492DRAFT_1009414 [Pavlovales sp. CCMP2436]